MTPTTCVIDTNVALDLWLFNRPSVAPLRAALAARSIVGLGTAALRDELACVLARGSLPDKWLFAGATEGVLESWDDHVSLVDPGGWAHTPGTQCTDPDDQKFIDLALAARAEWLFSRDKAVLKLGRRLRSEGIVVAVPERWPQP